MKRGLVWPYAMAGILALTVAGNIAVILIARGDPSFAIEKDYYARAVRWDSTMAQERRNQELAWTLEPTLGGFGDEGALLTVRLRDRAGAPLDGATVRVAALRNARASVIHEATLAPAPGDAYAARLPVHHGGAWELRFDVRHGADRFTAVARVDAVAAAAGS
jgi:nitrogen fixation protein FixH